MFAIVKVGASQYKIKEGDTIDTCRLTEEKGKDITLDQVLMVGNDGDVKIGQPYLTNVKITAKVLKHGMAAKVMAFKFRKRKSSSTQRAHRRDLTTLNITKISA